VFVLLVSCKQQVLLQRLHCEKKYEKKLGVAAFSSHCTTGSASLIALHLAFTKPITATMPKLAALLFCVPLLCVQAQENTSPLTIEKIMQDPKWIGTSPTTPQWTADGKYLFFRWNPEGAVADSSYYISLQNTTPQKATAAQLQSTVFYNNAVFNKARTAYTYSKNGDVYLAQVKDGTVRRLTQTVETESNPQFGFGDSRIVYRQDLNLFSYDLSTGLVRQLTNFRRGSALPREERGGNNPQEKWLASDQLQTMEVLRQRKQKLDLTDSLNRKLQPKELRPLYTEDKIVQAVAISPTGRFITYRLFKLPPGVKSTIIPNYVTESGFTTDINGRTKVGGTQGSYESFVYDTERDTVLPIRTSGIPGITEQPDYVKDYPAKDTGKAKRPQPRPVQISNPYWNESGSQAFVEITSQDNKDRWLMLLDAATGRLTLADRQRDEAWVNIPGSFSFARDNYWIDDNTFWYQSEKTGYSHLYTFSVKDSSKRQLTSGNFEVTNVVLSNDKKSFYFTSNEVHPGEQHLYKMAVAGGRRERLTSMTGANTATLSPDEKQAAILYSYSNKPWELYLQSTSGSTAKQITSKAQTTAFAAYPWRDPKVFTIAARDGQPIYSRLYQPAKPNAAKAAVIFVHGAGYLQNAHKWWSSYFREYMFNNLLVDNGYTVLDIDYRGSAGYGRDWRTGIYRYMGGKDLDDEMDAVKYLVDSLGINPKHIGMYGGSYGGFMTLMALFTQPGKINAGAALRPVTDWAHYNHGYTSNILNEPYNDSIAYRRSSPIYFASGLQDHLLICHGMVDVNVHFQDVVRLTQRLIELGKDNWQLAPYPMEDHGFVEPSSWTDEYKRIFKLFQENLK
jgi:dipeptidyl aminopeptidase/acylaminoacyl peptidase